MVSEQEIDMLAAECLMEEEGDTWFPDYAGCSWCRGYIFSPVICGDPVAIQLGMCPCAAILEDGEDDEPQVIEPSALSLSLALGIENCSKYKTDDGIAKRFRHLPTKNSVRYNTGNWQRTQRKHRNIRQPRPGF